MKRKLGLFQTTMYGVGLILGAGIYVIIGPAAKTSGSEVWLSFLIAAGLASLTGLSYAELASIYPKEAAEYVYVKSAFGNQFLAFLVGWSTVSASVLGAAAVALGFSGYLSVFSNLPFALTALLLLIALSLLNFIGIEFSSWTNTIFTLIEASGLILVIYAGFSFTPTKSVNLLDNPYGVNGLIPAVILTFFAFIGFESIANIVEEMKNPSKILPRALLLSLLIVTVLYLLVAVAAIRVEDWRILAASSAPLAEILGVVEGSTATLALSVIALFATTNTVLISLISGSRILYGMAEQRSFPKILSNINRRTGTPGPAIIVVMILAALFALTGNIVLAANVTVFTALATFSLVNLSLIRLRYAEGSLRRPFKVPLNIGRFPLLPALGLLASLALASQLDPIILSAGTALLGLGCVFFVTYTKFRKAS